MSQNDGTLRMYRANGTGGWVSRYPSIGTGWNGLPFPVTGATPSSPTTTLPPLGKGTFADHVAQWNVLCGDHHNGADDPIVHPGEFGAPHMHTSFGNTTTNAASTLASLKATTSNCGRDIA